MERSDGFRELLKRFGVKNEKKGEPERKLKRDCRQPVLYSPSASESSVRRSARKKIPSQKFTANPPVVRLPVSKPSDNKTKENVDRKGKAVDRSRKQGDGKKPDSVDRSNSLNVGKKRKPTAEETSSKRLKRSLNPDLNPQNTSTPRVKRTVSVNLSSRFPSDENDSTYRSASLRTRAENDDRPQASLLLEQDSNRLNRRRDDDFVVPVPPPRGRKENYYDNRDVPSEPQQFDRYDATRRPTAGQPHNGRPTELYSPSVRRNLTVKKTNAQPLLISANHSNVMRQPVSKSSDNKSKEKVERKRKDGDRSRERGDGKKPDSVDRSCSLNGSKKRNPAVEETSNKRLKRSQNQDLNRQNSPKNIRTVNVNLSSRFPADKNDSSYFSSSLRLAEDDERPQPSLLLEQQSNRLNRQRDDDFVAPELPSRASAFSQVPPHVRRNNYYENRDFPYESRQFDRYDAPRRPVGQSVIDLDYQPAELNDSIGPSASQLPDSPVRRYNYDIPWSRQQQVHHIKQPYVRIQDFNRSRAIRNHDEERPIRRPIAFPTTRDADGFLRPTNPLPLQPLQQSSSEDHILSSSLASLMETVEEVINEDAPALDIAFCLKEAERTLVIWNSKMIENLQLYDSARESLINAPRYAQSSNEQAVLNWVVNDERQRLQMMSNNYN